MLRGSCHNYVGHNHICSEAPAVKRKIRARAVLFGMRLSPIDEFVAARVIGYIVMAQIVMASIVMAQIVMASIVMADRRVRRCTGLWPTHPAPTLFLATFRGIPTADAEG